MGISKLLFDKNVYKIVGEKAGNSMENCRGWGVAIGDELLAFGCWLLAFGFWHAAHIARDEERKNSTWY
ncbi:MAG: hypothetical protein ABFC84_14310 [Veillonellales bacterium]